MVSAGVEYTATDVADGLQLCLLPPTCRALRTFKSWLYHHSSYSFLSAEMPLRAVSHCISTHKSGIGSCSQLPWSWYAPLFAVSSLRSQPQPGHGRSSWASSGTMLCFYFSLHPRSSREMPSGNSTSATSTMPCPASHLRRDFCADVPSSGHRSSAPRPPTPHCPQAITRRSPSIFPRRLPTAPTSRTVPKRVMRVPAPRRTPSRTPLPWTA